MSAPPRPYHGAHMRHPRPALLLAVALAALLTMGAEEPIPGSTTAYTAILVFVAIAFVVVIAWMIANRRRKPPE
jgi:hypothetical protein